MTRETVDPTGTVRDQLGNIVGIDQPAASARYYPKPKLTDTDKLLTVLGAQQGGWIAHSEIIWHINFTYGHGITIHSRAADLRKRGYDVQNRLERRNGRVISYYRLVTP